MFVVYKEKNQMQLSAVPSLKSSSILSFESVSMFSSEYRRMEWNWVGYVCMQMRAPLRKMDYLNGVFPEDVYCQRFSCAIPLYDF